MGRELPIRSDWQDQVVATLTRAGQVYVLLGIRKSMCDLCRYGIHFDTLWGSTAGEVNRITWCGSCFNAECDPQDMDENLHQAWRRLVRELDAEPQRPYWPGARPAIEDLERRGLV